MSQSLTSDERDLLALHLVPGLGPRLTAALLERFESPSAVLQARPAQLQEVPHIGARLAEDLHQAFQKVQIDPELKQLDQHGARLRFLGTPDYPAPLACIPDPPHVLYMIGGLETRDLNAVALVGSRQCTTYGKRVTARLATGLVQAGFTVISGLARGIDGAAHRAALEAGGRTLAILAGGLSKIYPPEHEELARQVSASGALLSESTMGMEPMAGMFPARNRIISGLSRAVVIVEAAERSGALITANHAAEQGRTVFAIPGPVDSSASSGTNKLLREGAILARHVEDILEELDGLRSAETPPPQPTAPPPDLNDQQRRIWTFLAEQPRHLDEMVQHLRLSVPEITSALLLLEMKKVVRRLPGNRYEQFQ